MPPTDAQGPLPSEAVPGTQEAASPEQLLPSPGPPADPGLLAPGVDMRAISRTIHLYRPPGPLSSSQPLVVLLPWFGAQPRALARYLALYLGRSWPVLLVESALEHFLWPRWGLAYAARVLGLLGEGKALGSHPLLIHAFSIGGYTFAQMMVHLTGHPEQHAGMRERIRGLVYDSLVAGSLADMARGEWNAGPLLGEGRVCVCDEGGSGGRQQVSRGLP